MPQPARAPASRSAFVQLLRPANVVTSLADVLAGYGVAGLALGADLAWLLLATACLYAGGVVLNDYFDRKLDAVERPERPIPSGRVQASSALALGAGLLAAGVASARHVGVLPGGVAAAVALAVLLYDTWGKHQALLGPVNMGLCRALNLLLGMAAAPAVLARHWTLGLLPLVYIAAVTMVSRGEVSGGKRPVVVAALVMVAGVIVSVVVLAQSRLHDPATGLQSALGGMLVGVFAWRVLPAFIKGVKTPDPETLRRAVRTGVLSLVFLDAVIAAFYADIIYCLVILLTGVVATRLARLFAVT
jgi:hypothetical protein